jgi:hypothetical protein
MIVAFSHRTGLYTDLSTEEGVLFSRHEQKTCHDATSQARCVPERVVETTRGGPDTPRSVGVTPTPLLGMT